MAVPKKTINDILNPRVVDKEKYISEDINYLKDIINKKAGVIDMMSPGPLKDELRGTYDPTQESYEEFLQRQSIPQMDRPLTGQAPSDAILETQRIDLNEGGVLGPGGMFRGEDLGTREGFAVPTYLKDLFKTEYKKSNYNLKDILNKAKKLDLKGRSNPNLNIIERMYKAFVADKRALTEEEYLKYIKDRIKDPNLPQTKGWNKPLVGTPLGPKSTIGQTKNTRVTNLAKAEQQLSPEELKNWRAYTLKQSKKLKEFRKTKQSIKYDPQVDKFVYNPEIRLNALGKIYVRKNKRRALQNDAYKALSPRERLLAVQNEKRLLAFGDIIKNNPGYVLKDKATMDLLSTAVDSKTGDIYKKTPTFTNIKGRRILELEHIDPVVGGTGKGRGAMLNNIQSLPEPLHKNFKGNAEIFLNKNINNPQYKKQVNDIVNKANDLKISLNIKGKVLGYKPKYDFFLDRTDEAIDFYFKNPKLKQIYADTVNNFAKPDLKYNYYQFGFKKPLSQKELTAVTSGLDRPAFSYAKNIPKGKGRLGAITLGATLAGTVGTAVKAATGQEQEDQTLGTSSMLEDIGTMAIGGTTLGAGYLGGKKLIEKTTGRFAPMIKGAIGKIAMSPFALPFRATGLDRMAMKKLGLLPEDETLAQTYDPRTASGRTTLALEGVAAGAYKPIAERLTSGIKNQTAKSLATGILKLGPRALNLANVLSKAARVTTPLGLTYLLGEGAYHLLIKPQKEYLESLDPEERKTVEQQYADVAAAEGGIIRKAYKDAGLVEKLGRGAAALDPRNIPYYGAKTLKGLGSGVEMAVKFPVAAGAAIGETIQKGPRKETLTKFGEAVQPSATQYLSEKTGLESLIRKQEKELAEKRPGALAMGDVLELGAEFVAPATGYIKMLEDGSSKLYKVIRDGQAGKKVDPKDIDEVLELLSDKGVERRDFMAVVGGTSALALAKHVGIIDALKILEKTKPVRMLSKSASKMPEWFPSFASRILDDTNSVFKQVDEDLVEITNKNLPDVSVGKYSSGRWEISGYNEYGKPYLIDYEPPFILEDGTKYAGDFSVFDNVPSRMGPDDVEFDSELVESIDDVLGGTSKLEEWTTGVKKKNLTPGEKRVIEAEGRAEADYDAWKESDDFVDE